MHREKSKFKQSILTLVPPVSSVGIGDITLYNTENDLIREYETD